MAEQAGEPREKRPGLMAKAPMDPAKELAAAKAPASPQRPDPARLRGRRFVIAFVTLTALAVIVSLGTNLWRRANSEARPALAQSTSPAPQAVKTERLEIVSGEARHQLSVEVMRSEAERARGLMFRQSMPADQGMLFDFERDGLATMWMKNTFIPLDMVFVFADGRIHRIEANTEPQSERTISSGVPVRAVLELNAGAAARLKLKPGDRLIHPMFKPVP